MSLEMQFLVFVLAIAIGAGAAFLFDFYRAVRVTLRLGRLGTGIGDLLAWVLLTAAVFGALILINWGDVRWYIFLGLGAGASLYHRKFARFGLTCWDRVIVLTLRVIGVLLSPFRFIGRLGRRLGVLIFSPVHRVAARLRMGLRGRSHTTPSEGPPPGTD